MILSERKMIEFVGRELWLYPGSGYDYGRNSSFWVQNVSKEDIISGYRIWSKKAGYLGSEYYQGRKDIWVQNMNKDERVSGFRIWSGKEVYLGSEYYQGRKDIWV